MATQTAALAVKFSILGKGRIFHRRAKLKERSIFVGRLLVFEMFCTKERLYVSLFRSYNGLSVDNFFGES